MNTDGEPVRLGSTRLKSGREASIYHVQHGNRHTLYVPTDEEFPDASRSSVVEGEFEDGRFTIHRMDTGSRHEHQGLGRSLLAAIAKGLNANEIVALSPSAEAEEKGFYESSGFQREGRNRVWRRRRG